MSNRDRAPTTVRRRIPRPLAVVLVLLVGYGVLWLASNLMSKSLLDGASLQLLGPDGQPVPGVAVLGRWWEPKVLHTGCDLGKSDDSGQVDLTPLRGKTAVLGKFEVAILLPGYDQDPITLQRDTTVTLPPVGKLVVQLRDEQGGRWSDPSLPHMKARIRWSKGEGFQHFQEDGSAVFSPVACTKFQLFADLQQHKYGASGDAIDGPADAGKTRTVEIVIPNSTPKITGTVHDSDDKPVSGSFTLTLETAGGSLSAYQVTSGEDGRWQFLLDSLPTTGKLTLAHRDLGQAAATVPADSGTTVDVGTMRLPSGSRP